VRQSVRDARTGDADGLEGGVARLGGLDPQLLQVQVAVLSLVPNLALGLFAHAVELGLASQLRLVRDGGALHVLLALE
jgi:hypothetical protein